MLAALPPAQVGNIMAEYPLDPQLAKMVVASPEFRFVGGEAPCACGPELTPPAAQRCPCWVAAAREPIGLLSFVGRHNAPVRWGRTFFRSAARGLLGVAVVACQR